MKLRNKKTGEIVDLSEGFIKDVYSGTKIQIKPVAISNKEGYVYNSLAELNEEWEDYEEPKEYWYISDNGHICSHMDEEDSWDEFRKGIGNYFETKEEAEQAVRKLKVWKRLKDKGFRFEGVKEDYIRFSHNQIPYRNGRRYLQFNKAEDEDWLKENWDDIKLLFFGGEE